MSDSVMRRLAILNMLPQGGVGMSTSDIEENLKRDGFDVSTRTVQRDLSDLSDSFPLIDDNVGRAKHWSFMKGSPKILIPNMDLDTALTLKLTQQHLLPLIPQRVRSFLEPYFPEADKVLQDHPSRFTNWIDTTRAISLGLPQEAPPIDSGVFAVLSQAIVDQSKCEVSYRANHRDKAKTYRISPLAMVIRGPVTYLLAIYEGFADVRQMAMHRFSSARELFDQADQPERFNLDDYIRQGHFGILYDPTPQPLQLTVSKAMARILQEAPLSTDQKITPQDEGARVSVTLPESWDLYRWLLSHSSDVRVESPQHIRDKLVDYLQASLAQYDTCPA